MNIAPAKGRPFGVALDRQGALLVAEDVRNATWHESSGRQAQGGDNDRQLFSFNKEKKQ